MVNLKKIKKLDLWQQEQSHTIDRVGVYFHQNQLRLTSLGPGEIGFINSGIKSVSDCKVGRHNYR